MADSVDARKRRGNVIKRIEQPRVFAVASGKGGVGKTNLAANLAVALGSLGQRVLLFDADLGLANTEVLFGLSPRQDVRHVLTGKQTLEEVLLAGPEGIGIIPASSGVASLAELPAEAGDDLVAKLAALSLSYDHVLVDVPPGIGSNALRFTEMADELLVIMTPEPTSVTDAYALVKLMQRRRPDLPVRVILNMTMAAEEAQRVTQAFGEITTRFLGVDVETLGAVPWDDRVPEAVRRQQPFVLCYPNCRAARTIREICKELRRPRERRVAAVGTSRLSPNRVSGWTA
jgi:flagellar biosynthesis protein FlhG